ncbi:MAG: TatD family hydrolase [Anditalea sp.]
MNFIDSHAHIYSAKFNSDREEIIQRSKENGVHKIFMPNIDLDSIDPMLEAEQKYPGVCIPMMGLHPCDVDKEFQKQLYVMEDWLNKRPFAGVGEIGLDLYWDKSYLEHQKEALKVQITWAKEKGLPIILHCRESIQETIEIVRSMNDDQLTGIFHCFTGSLEQAQEIIDMGFLLGIGGVATFKNGGLDKVLPSIGLDKLVLETDAPYLAPVPHRGKRNSPEFIPLIAQKVGDLTESSLDRVSETTNSNATKVFKHS